MRQASNYQVGVGTTRILEGAQHLSARVHACKSHLPPHHVTATYITRVVSPWMVKPSRLFDAMLAYV
jgi:hypothetical protein